MQPCIYNWPLQYKWINKWLTTWLNKHRLERNKENEERNKYAYKMVGNKIRAVDHCISCTQKFMLTYSVHIDSIEPVGMTAWFLCQNVNIDHGKGGGGGYSIWCSGMHPCAKNAEKGVNLVCVVPRVANPQKWSNFGKKWPWHLIKH